MKQIILFLIFLFLSFHSYAQVVKFEGIFERTKQNVVLDSVVIEYIPYNIRVVLTDNFEYDLSIILSSIEDDYNTYRTKVGHLPALFVEKVLEFSFNTKTNSNIKIKIFDLIGNQVLEQDAFVNSEYSEIRIDCTNLLPGIYLFMLINGGDTFRGRFVKVDNEKGTKSRVLINERIYPTIITEEGYFRFTGYSKEYKPVIIDSVKSNFQTKYVFKFKNLKNSLDYDRCIINFNNIKGRYLSDKSIPDDRGRVEIKKEEYIAEIKIQADFSVKIVDGFVSPCNSCSKHYSVDDYIKICYEYSVQLDCHMCDIRLIIAKIDMDNMTIDSLFFLEEDITHCIVGRESKNEKFTSAKMINVPFEMNENEDISIKLDDKIIKTTLLNINYNSYVIFKYLAGYLTNYTKLLNVEEPDENSSIEIKFIKSGKN